MVKLEKINKKPATENQLNNLEKARAQRKKNQLEGNSEKQKKLREQYGIQSSSESSESSESDPDTEEIVYKTVRKTATKDPKKEEKTDFEDIKYQLTLIQNSLIKPSKVVKKPRKPREKKIPDPIKSPEPVIEPVPVPIPQTPRPSIDSRKSIEERTKQILTRPKIENLSQQERINIIIAKLKK